jgi:hypothetical protein
MLLLEAAEVICLVSALVLGENTWIFMWGTLLIGA